MKRTVILGCLLGCTLTAARSAVPVSLDSVYAPVIVGTPPSDAFIGLSRMPDGELRHYNYGSHPASAQPLYLSSRDSGLTWHSVTLPYDLELGLSPECVVVWYLDEEGGVTPCDTRYNPVTDEVTFTTGHFSKYAIAYDPSLLPVPPQRPSYSLPEDDRLQLALPLTIAGVAVVLLVFLFLLGQLILSGRQDKWRR